MRETTLPSPNIGSRGYHLRRIAAQAISQIEVAAVHYSSGAHPDAGDLKAFFDACSAAAATVSKSIPNMTFTTAGNATSVAAAATLATSVGKGGSSGAVSYSSSNEAVATVNGSGVITGVAAGTVTITASMAEGSAHKAATRTVTVTVTA